jgi:hypothetical protein
VRIRYSSCVRTCVLFVVAVMMAVSVNAQTRYWVSGVGNDVDPCSRTAPCKTFAGAMAKPNPLEINALDPGGFGAVTLDQAITIDGGGTYASILGAGATGILVNAGASDVVTIRNLSINGAGTGVNGIRITGGKSVLIENCSIFGFQKGIDFEPLGGMTVTVKNTTIQHNSNSGIFVKTTGAFFARLTVVDSRLTDNATGLMVQDNSLVFVTGTSASNNTGSGFYAQSTFGGAAQLDIENSTTANNGNAGVVSQNPNAVATISNVTVDHNLGAGIVPLAGGQILTANNNKVNGNAGGPGTTTGVLTIM